MIPVTSYKKPKPGDIIKTTTLVVVNEFVDDLPGRRMNISEGNLALLIDMIGENQYIFLYNNAKYIYLHRTYRKTTGYWLPFTVVS